MQMLASRGQSATRQADRAGIRLLLLTTSAYCSQIFRRAAGRPPYLEIRTHAARCSRRAAVETSAPVPTAGPPSGCARRPSILRNKTRLLLHSSAANRRLLSASRKINSASRQTPRANGTDYAVIRFDSVLTTNSAAERSAGTICVHLADRSGHDQEIHCCWRLGKWLTNGAYSSRMTR